ncbi:MAG TPA: GDP-mannose 4,6-dehydratase [Candidatus Krumholzibacteria bacterium]|nr:GDP-mannose 4,6-dehydratase [Candidatus Krumholzibacteria bacterium]HPD70970.1 GDP-mannose 4,6-dehydratase [Candidatus Krumholzibacteria bacterium]HRY39330.1 GDP-mannose 4,6-dehydratase [Candidatus Krumholzibacteria bacterium]
MRRVLITGARGFVGRHLAAALAADGIAVAGLDVPPPAAATRSDPPWIVHHHTLGALETEAGARRLADLLRAGGHDAVVHLAGQSSAAASFGDPAGTFRANALGTLELLEALRLLAAQGSPVPRLLSVGSGEEYGAAATPARPCREDDPVVPVTPYGASKAAATLLCRQYHRSYRVPVVATRSFNHTGTGQDQRFVFPGLAAQIAAAEAGRRAPVLATGNLQITRDFLDVRDVVAAYRLLLERGEPGRVYNVCSGSALTIGQGLQILLGFSTAAIAVTPDPARVRPADIPHLVGDPALLGEATGWRPRFEFSATLRDLLEDARRNLA